MSTSANHGLDASWSNASYRVSFSTGVGGLSCSSINVTYNSPYGTLPAVSREGYTFNGWKYAGNTVTSATIVTETMNHTLTADWSINTYNVTWVIDGITVGTTELEFGSEIVPTIEIPAREGFKAQWNPEELPARMPAKNITVNAIFPVMPCDVTLSTSLGGDVLAFVSEDFVSPHNGILEIPYGTTVKFKPVCRVGYALSQIYVTHEDGEKEYLNGYYTLEISDAITFTAIFVENDSRNVVSVQNGTVNGRRAVNVDMFEHVTVIADKPLSGMKFAYWTDKNDTIVSYDEVYQYVVTSAVTLTAHYVQTAEQVNIVPSIVTNAASDAHITLVNDTYSLTYTGKIILPDNCELVEFGLLLCDKADGYTSGNFIIDGTVGSSQVKKIVCETISESNQIMMSVNRVAENSIRAGRFYMIYRDADNNLITVYSNAWSILTAK